MIRCWENNTTDLRRKCKACRMKRAIGGMSLICMKKYKHMRGKLTSSKENQTWLCTLEGEGV